MIIGIVGAFIGGFLGNMITGTPLNVSSFMGLILLVGLIVKNGIILLDFTHHRMRTEGLALLYIKFLGAGLTETKA